MLNLRLGPVHLPLDLLRADGGRAITVLLFLQMPLVAAIALMCGASVFWPTFSVMPDILRVLLHAIAFVSEGVALSVLTLVLIRIFARSEAGRVQARAARCAAEGLLADHSAAQVLQSQFMTTLIGRTLSFADDGF